MWIYIIKSLFSIDSNSQQAESVEPSWVWAVCCCAGNKKYDVNKPSDLTCPFLPFSHQTKHFMPQKWKSKNSKAVNVHVRWAASMNITLTAFTLYKYIKFCNNYSIRLFYSIISFILLSWKKYTQLAVAILGFCIERSCWYDCTQKEYCYLISSSNQLRCDSTEQRS